MITRTQDEIVARIEERQPADVFGFEWPLYIEYLDLEHVRPFLRDPDEPWNPTSVDPIDHMLDYMDFAWEKANNCRGISASRSIEHCIAWLWLAGEDELTQQVDHAYNNTYHHYGKPILEMICDHFGWDWRRWDDGVRTNG